MRLVPGFTILVLLGAPLVSRVPLPGREEASRIPNARAESGYSMACSNANGSITPCDPILTVNAGSTGSLFIFTLTNRSSAYREGGISCAYSGSVSDCTVSTSSYELQAHTSMVDTITYSAPPIVQLGTGSVTVSTGGLIGSLSSKLSLNITPLNACLPADAKSARLLSHLQEVGTAAGGTPALQRTQAKLSLLSSQGQVQQVTSGSQCALAASALDSIAKVAAPAQGNPYRRVYLYQFGTQFVVSDPKYRAGEWQLASSFASNWSYLGTIMF
jgi:hypothetical protein